MELHTRPAARTTMMWIPSKSAFRAGVINGSQWDIGNIGQYSFATSLNSNAVGIASTVLGGNSKADSFAISSYVLANNSYVNASESATIGYDDTTRGKTNGRTSFDYIIGSNNLIDTTYSDGYGNWLFGQFLHTTGQGVWAFGSDDSFTKHVIPFANSIVFYGEPVINWSTTGMDVGTTRLSTSYQSIQSRDSIRYGQYYTLRASGGYASFDIGSQRQFSINGTSGNLDNAYSHTYLSFNYDSLQGIYFNPTKTDAQPYGNVVIQNGNFSVMNGTINSGAITSSGLLGVTVASRYAAILWASMLDRDENPSNALSFGNTFGKKIALFENAAGANMYGIGATNNRDGTYSAQIFTNWQCAFSSQINLGDAIQVVGCLVGMEQTQRVAGLHYLAQILRHQSIPHPTHGFK